MSFISLLGLLHFCPTIFSLFSPETRHTNSSKIKFKGIQKSSDAQSEVGAKRFLRIYYIEILADIIKIIKLEKGLEVLITKDRRSFYVTIVTGCLVKYILFSSCDLLNPLISLLYLILSDTFVWILTPILSGVQDKMPKRVVFGCVLTFLSILVM